jgi:RHH-type proline utilization regulon transcriptional repressor/proline dehydrogenase/delta 1-pyrroline-5-carboxylate dehydrogenase
MPRLLPLLKRARELGAFVNFDVEQYERRDLAFHLFEQVLEHPDMGGYPHLGIVAQSYLRDARETLNHLLERARRRGSSFTVRLVKGAYWDYEVIHAQLMSRGIPVFSRKPRTDVRFEEMLEDLRRAAPQVRTAVASHNLRSIARALALGEMPGANPGALEVQTLFGMGDPIKHALVSMGIVPRVYIPYGPMIPGMGYLVRRLLENTSNDSFLKTSFFIHAPDNDLLRDPREDAAMTEAKPLHPPAGSPQEPSLTPHVFRNCPPIDFAILAERDRFAAALALVREKFGLEYPAVIGDERHLPGDSSGRDPAKWIRSLNPGCPSETVGWVPRCGPEHANHAIDAARRAFPAWSRTPATARARALRDAADYMAARRHEYAAWAVFEAGKPWREADGDVCEAIDFLRYYALEMESLASPSVTQPLPGERNEYGYTPLGPGVVIAPWNFPLAILCGMTAAALVAGNTVVMKPAEQTPVCGWMVYEALARGGGLANGVLNLVPGFGEEVGETLVAHPAAAFIAFTGSVSVGLHINEVAARHHPDRAGVTRVIAEMGGKNAIIVDESADIDAAVAGTIQSAFHYSGQKCSACSRALVLEPVYGKFVARLREAAGSLVVGPADAPETQVGPLIDHEAVERALRYGGQCVDGEPTGSQLVRPMIVEVRDHLLPLAQEEIFGPVLTVIQVRDFDEALRVANSTRFALTAGVYTRTPEHIDRARAEIEAGNLYINRTITGAIVGRQPFGGFKMSGIGSKAGGPDYLKQFLLPRTFTENTMRHGFAPVVPE